MDLYPVTGEAQHTISAKHKDTGKGRCCGDGVGRLSRQGTGPCPKAHFHYLTTWFRGTRTGPRVSFLSSLKKDLRLLDGGLGGF